MKNYLLGMDQNYSENSLAQDQCHELASKLLIQIAKNYKLESSSFNIGVYGCGPSDNDLIALDKYLLSNLFVSYPNLKVNIYMIDIAETKWSKQVTKTNDNIVIHGIKSDIYCEILPENSLDLVISFSCLHWLRYIPVEVNNEYSWADLNDGKKESIRNFLDESLVLFLNSRKKELKKSGKMLLSFDAEKNYENHQYQGPTDCLVSAIKKLKLNKDLKNFFVPTAPRDKERVENCIKISNLKLD